MNNNAYADIVTHLHPDAELVNRVRLTGGVSADVYRLDLRLADGGNTSIVLRAHRASHSGHPAKLEYRLLGALHRGGLPVPEPLQVDISGSLLENPFLLIEYVNGTSEIPAGKENQYIDAMAETLARIHAQPLTGLPPLPSRNDPLPEVYGYLPQGGEWQGLRAKLRSLVDTTYAATPRLLHGDFWPENLLWKNAAVAAVLDWEDAATGDPLSDVACARVELRYKFGEDSMQRFTHAYATQRPVDPARLALWQVYVAAAARHHMGEWGLEPALLAHMRREALLSIREAAAVLATSQ